MCAIFFVHLTLSVWAGQALWMPTSYLFYNFVFLMTLLWCLHHKDSEEPPFMALCVNLICIILDVVSLAIFWPTLQSSASKFSSAVGVIHVMCRPVSSFILYRIVMDRAGTYGNFGLPAGLDSIFAQGNNHRAPYEDIDNQASQNLPQSSPTNQGGPANDSPSKLFTT
ncbi:type-1 angiotensin II receptor-associated protein-like isoform X2 [Oratosquilla oratoria]|uniref:type-1 angiotensin II receptor-associated protein-like isoform X2 n=1 Tax=Oratosquilla oratoria TaxID=337810 RepID=UPI003F75B800